MVVSYVIKNKDIEVITFDIQKSERLQSFSNLRVIKEGLAPRFTDLGAWLQSRYKFSCARNVTDFFNSIGIKDLEAFIDIFHCTSLRDTFWVHRAGENISWSKVSPYRNNYSRLISRYSLEGLLIKDSKNYFSPDVSTDGSFPHTWKWKDDKIYFLKAGSKFTLGGINSGKEPISEYYAGKVAAYLGFKHVDYELRLHTRADKHVEYITECLCYTSEEIGTITANELGLKRYQEVYEYCSGLNCSEQFLDMLFLDCLLMNTDRHFSNIEFFVENDTQRIVGLVPIFDNNFSFLPRFIEGIDIFDRKEYAARTEESFESLFGFISKHKDYSKPLHQLKRLRLVQPDKCKIADKRLEFLNWFLQEQVDYWLSYKAELPANTEKPA